MTRFNQTCRLLVFLSSSVFLTFIANTSSSFRVHLAASQPAQKVSPISQQSEIGAGPRLESLIEQAKQQQGRGDYQNAAASYEQALELSPHSAEMRANLGLMYYLLQEYGKATRNLDLAVQEKPRLFVPNLFLGLTLLELQMGVPRFLNGP